VATASAYPAADPRRATQLFAAAAALRAAMGVALAPAERTRIERALEAARRTLSPEDFTAAWAAGEAMTLERAIAYALETVPPGSPAPVLLPEQGGTS
jgi:hypothetical protein